MTALHCRVSPFILTPVGSRQGPGVRTTPRMQNLKLRETDLPKATQLWSSGVGLVSQKAGAYSNPPSSTPQGLWLLLGGVASSADRLGRGSPGARCGGCLRTFTKTSILPIALLLIDRFFCTSPRLLKALLCTIQTFVRRGTYSDPDFEEPAFLGEEGFNQGGP